MFTFPQFTWCASSAVYALRRVTQDADLHFSDDAISAIRSGFYVDDLLLSYSCPDRALSVWKEVKEGLATRGFNVTKFVTYHPQLSASIPDAERAKEVKIFPEQSITKTLGMRWNVCSCLSSKNVAFRVSTCRSGVG